MIGLSESDLAILSNFGGVEHNDLINILQIDPNEPQVIQHSSYYDMDGFNNLITNTKHYFSILSINIQSINAKFHELETLIESSETCSFILASYACKNAGYQTR